MTAICYIGPISAVLTNERLLGKERVNFRTIFRDRRKDGYFPDRKRISEVERALNIAKFFQNKSLVRNGIVFARNF